jgi:hypothetical protein
MKVKYKFSVLRYIHDPVTQEFVNIGVALYSEELRHLDALCAVNYGRISRMFTKINGYRFRQSTRYIQDQIKRLGDEIKSGLPFESKVPIEKLLAEVLPPDDSAFQFSPAGAGISADMGEALKELFDRLVEKYAQALETSRRDDEEVWKDYREPLEQKLITPLLSAKRIVAPNYDYEFQHSWKNQFWHVYEPVSFDLIEAASIVDKANRWLGRATSLSESKEKFKIHVLLGEPHETNLRSAFTKAQNILHKMPGNPEFVRESEAKSFAQDLAQEIKAHAHEDDLTR